MLLRVHKGAAVEERKFVWLVIHNFFLSENREYQSTGEYPHRQSNVSFGLTKDSCDDFCDVFVISDNTHAQFFHIVSRFSFTNVSEYFLQIPPGIPTMQYLPNGSSRHPHGNMKKVLVDVIYIVVNQETDLSRFGLNTHSLSSFYMVLRKAASFFGHQINRLSLFSIITKIWEKELSLQNFNRLQV